MQQVLCFDRAKSTIALLTDALYYLRIVPPTSMSISAE